MDEERVLSIMRAGEGWSVQYSSISEFKEHSNGAALADEKLKHGWVLWHHSNLISRIQQNIITFLKSIGSTWIGYNYLIQFWAVEKVEGQHHYLSTSNQPFYVGALRKGNCWYRKECMNRVYSVHMEEAEAEQLGSVGRAYRNKHPESTPDLRLYSTHEFPLRDHAARCGFKPYFALPLFDLHHQHPCYGVMEILTDYNYPLENNLFATLDARLQIAGLRSTHINFIPISRYWNNMSYKYMPQADSEISELLELSIKAVPRLSLAQVWVPCKQCVNMTTNLCCMERESFINSQDRILSECNKTDDDMFHYLQASEFHNLQIDLSCFGRDLYDIDLSISKNPLAHYAKMARLPISFAICLQRVNNNSNHFHMIEFLLQPKYREDACVDSSLHLILRIMEMKLKSYKFALVGQLPLEFVDQSRQPPDAIGFECIDMLNRMDYYTEILSDSNFTKYLEIVDLCCSQPSDEGWVVCGPVREGLVVKDKIVRFLKEIAGKIGEKYCMVQFWAPKIKGDRQCLDASDQPYALGYLAKGLASFRKECMKHHYFVDEEAKEEELGPPGRVFRNGHPELFHDPFFYSAKEFSMRSYALHCGLKNYFVLPVFDEHHEFNKHECVGVLEFLGLCCSDEEFGLRDIIRALRAVKLRSTQIHSHPTLIKANIHDCKVEAMNEIEDAIFLFRKIPQCHTANVWVCNGKCMDSKSWCMKWVASTGLEPTLIDKRIHVEPRIGMIGMVLESESKSCFCRNICEFSITDQPLAYHERAERRHACYAICLQSSHTEDLLYVLEFFLYPSPATCEYLRSFLHILMPTMKHRLKSFKIASGKQLGEELVVEILEFSEANQLISAESNQLNVFPVKFKSVLYGQKEHQHIEEQMVRSNPKFTQRKQCRVVISNFCKTEKGKRKTGLHLSLEVLKPHFGKKLEDVAEELGIGRSTIKRACRDYGINRWPGNEKQARNPSLFERASTQDHHQDMQPSSSNNLQVWDVPNTNTESTQLPVVQEEAEKVMIKVKHQGDIIRFELHLSLGVVKLSEEVARRLNLEVGTFKLKYMDEDNEEILIGCDEDLQLCPKSVTSMGKTCVQLFIPK